MPLTVEGLVIGALGVAGAGYADGDEGCALAAVRQHLPTAERNIRERTAAAVNGAAAVAARLASVATIGAVSEGADHHWYMVVDSGSETRNTTSISGKKAVSAVSPQPDMSKVSLYVAARPARLRRRSPSGRFRSGVARGGGGGDASDVEDLAFGSSRGLK